MNCEQKIEISIKESTLRRRCILTGTTPVLFAYGELYCFAVIFVLRQAVLPSAVYVRIKHFLLNKIFQKGSVYFAKQIQ